MYYVICGDDQLLGGRMKYIEHPWYTALYIAFEAMEFRPGEAVYIVRATDGMIVFFRKGQLKY